jgi:hydroxypyruvate isomerase
MVRFAPNLYHQFRELELYDRFAAAAQAGFDAIEYHFPTEIPRDTLRSLLRDNGLRFLYGVIPADWSKGNYGLGGQPGRQEEFRRAADLALEYAAHCDFWSIQVGHGWLPEGVERSQCMEVLAQNLQYICDAAAGTELRIVLEPVTSARFNKPFVLSTMAQGAEVMRMADRGNLKLVYDTYHLRMEETGPLSAILDAYWPMIGYVQIGNAPGRNEPGVGEIDLHHIIEAVERKGYEAWIGLEYDPSKDTWSSLAWANRYGYQVKR